MKRNPDESLEEYKLRRERDRIQTEAKLRGRVFWDSENLGTYRKKDRKK